MTNHHQSKSNKTTMLRSPIIIVVTIIVGAAVSQVFCVPNQRTESFNAPEKQFSRKPLGSGSDDSSSNNQPRTDLSISGLTTFQCPEQFGYYMDQRDCTKYYVCVFGEVLHESCTGGLRFSRELQTCDWPRNVECQNGSANSSTSSPQPVTTPSSSSSSSSTSSGLAKQLAAENDERTGLLKGSALVFADEGSDPQQPSFDEAVSPVITPDGTIHLHDGSGGTFGLPPNHNRAALQQLSSNQQSRGQSVNVFVKPLLTQRSKNQQQVPVVSKLLAATLPNQRIGQHHSQHVDHHSSPTQTTTPTNFNNNDQFTFTERDNEQPTESEANAEESPIDSVGAQADQEAADQENQADQEQPDPDQDQSQADKDDKQQLGSVSDYIPPVMASNSVRPLGPNRHSSQLLSINNQQIVDSRQTFKPIMFTQPPSHLISTSSSSQNKPQTILNQNNFNQRPSALNGQTQQDDSGLRSINSNKQTRQNQTLYQDAQNNRQSRMSKFQQHFNQPSNSVTNERQQARFLQQQSNQVMNINNNNVNFNDTSKLIRLQASQFEQLLPNTQPQNGLNSFPKFAPQNSPRSQNVLFSQQPFGFVADSNSNQIQPESSPTQQFEAGFRTTPNEPNNFQLLQQQQRRPRPPKRTQIPSGWRPPSNQFRPVAAPDPTTTGQPSTFVNDQDQPEEFTQPTPPRIGQVATIRQINAPAAINPHQQDSIANFGPGTPSFSTTPSSPTTRRLNESGPQANRNTITNLQTSIQGQHLRNHAQLMSLSEPAPPAVSLNGSDLPGNEQDDSTSNPSSANGSPTNANPATASVNQEQSDPQLTANRYLNSAIDVLEAGQPFGAIDYDFDILNENSTERRNPTGDAHQSANQTFTNSNNNPNANRQKHHRHESVTLSNGQPDSSSQLAGNQVGTSSSFRPTRPRTGLDQPSSSRVSNQKQFEPVPVGTSSPQPAGGSGSRRPRPTNKKIVVNHEQALANSRASIEPAKRPESVFSTPVVAQTATKCDNRVCRLPDCKCGDTLVPGNLDPKQVPQIVLLTFDDAVNDLNWELYEELFTGRTNPNGCPILATFYVSHEWTDYGQVQTLYSRGHEMASHSVTHSFGEKFSKNQWLKEVNGQREILNMYGGVAMNDVRGMRAPFLQIGGNKMFEMLYDANFTYDSSMPIFENSPPLWPYTLDYQMSHECMITPCPTKSYPGVWEVGMTMWVDLRGGRCSMGDACTNPVDEDGVHEMLMKNFNRHYKSNRAPFGLFYHSAWFSTAHHRRGFLRFLNTVNAFPDVFFVTNWQMLQWMRRPTPLSDINSFEPWQCPANNDRPSPCYHPSVCNVKSEHGTRFMKTCQPCPANQQYPWVGSTGFKGKQTGTSGSG